MDAFASCREPNVGYAAFDFYDGLAALLHICDIVTDPVPSVLNAWLPRAQGYLNVALKHLPDIGGEDYTQCGLAAQWRAANLLDCAAPISGRWLQQQLIVECDILTAHPGFYYFRAALPEAAAVVVFFARQRAGISGLFGA